MAEELPREPQPKMPNEEFTIWGTIKWIPIVGNNGPFGRTAENLREAFEFYQASPACLVIYLIEFILSSLEPDIKASLFTKPPLNIVDY